MKKNRAAVLALVLGAVSASASIAEPPRWRQIGPEHLAFGQMNVLAFDPHRPSRAFAGSLGGGIARSGDGGRTWRTMSEGLTELRVRSIVVHPALGRLVYAIADGVVHRSSNDGRTWVRLPLERARSIAPDPRDPAVVWAGTEVGLFLSRDSGDTWERVRANLPPGPPEIKALAVDARDPRRIYTGIAAARGAGFWVSENGGQTWIRRSPEVPDALYADLRNAGTVFLLHSGTLFRSRDGGRTLQPFFAPPILGAAAALLAPDPQNASAFFLTASKRHGEPPAVLRTTDDGRTWQPFAVGLPSGLEPTALAVSSDGHVLLAARMEEPHHEVFRSDASEPNWELASRGLIDNVVNAVTVGRAGTLFVNVYGKGVLRSRDGGASWTVSNPIDEPSALVAAPSDPDTLYAGGFYPGGEDPHIAWRTTDGGETWTPLPYPPPLNGPHTTLAAIDLAVDPADPRTVFLGTITDGGTSENPASLFRSQDGGQTWERVGPPGVYEEMKVFPGDPGKMLALWNLSAVYRSIDHGETWEKVLDPSGEFSILHHLAVAPSNPEVVYATQDEGTLLRSGDGGATFLSLGSRLPAILLPSIAVDPSDPDTLVFAGAEGVVRLTLGRGRELLQPAFFSRQIMTLLFDPNDPLRLLAGTAGAGLVEYRFAAP